eukprot:COSAG02_NODE_225_length_28184_cov_16.570981_10_plen_150_part_00
MAHGSVLLVGDPEPAAYPQRDYDVVAAGAAGYLVYRFRRRGMRSRGASRYVLPRAPPPALGVLGIDPTRCARADASAVLVMLLVLVLLEACSSLGTIAHFTACVPLRYGPDCSGECACHPYEDCDDGVTGSGACSCSFGCALVFVDCRP